MKVLIVGGTAELVLVADVLQKAGSTIYLEKDADAEFDVLVWSSEASELSLERLLEGVSVDLICDIAGGRDMCADDGPALSEFDLQAATGLVDTTGFPDGPSTRSRVPYIAVSTALYAATLITAAFMQGFRGRIDVSRFVAAAFSLTTFLPAALQGTSVSRIGNAHPASSPWNSYPTRDGWILICTSKDDQWNRLCDVAKRAELSDDKFRIQADRVRLRDQLDNALASWTSTKTTQQCADALIAAGVPVGPITPVDELASEENVQTRQPNLVKAVRDGASPSELLEAVALYKDEPTSARPQPTPLALNAASHELPLRGLKVVEIGQFTAVPLAGRHLAHMGADVLKIEQPGGEAARSWAPLLDGVSHYYTISNSGKRVVELDFKSADDLTWLKNEISQADVFIENLRPGVLAKFGLGLNELFELKTSIVACSVSGFGAETAYPGRAAFDTVVQGMSGIMDVTRSEGRPVKMGISVADILGAQVALFGIINGLLQGGARFIDVAMQDVSVYAAFAANAGLTDTMTTVPVRSVLDLANSQKFADHCLTRIRDQSGVFRASVRMPYALREFSLEERQGGAGLKPDIISGRSSQLIGRSVRTDR